MRTGLLADKLLVHGHQILWWTSAFSHFTKSWEYRNDGELKISEDYSLYYLKGVGYNKHFSLKRFLDHRIIAKKFKYYAKRFKKPDLIIVSSPPHDLAFESVCYAKKNDILVFVDIKDPWPDSFVQHFPKLLKKVGNVVLFFERRLMKKALINATGIIAVSQQLLQFGLQYAKRSQTVSDCVFYNGYHKIYPDEASLKPELKSLIERIIRNKLFVVLFLGTFSHTHNPAIIIDCAEKLKELKMLFLLAGHGEFAEMLIKKKGDLTNVEFTGWLNKEEIEIIIKYANVGICPTSFEMNIIPNKALIYLSVGLPVISSFQGDLKYLLAEFNAGFYYHPGNLNNLIKHIRYLFLNPDFYLEMSENAKKLYLTYFNSELIYSNYANYLESAAKVLLKK